MIWLKQFLKHVLRNGASFRRSLQQAELRYLYTSEQIALCQKERLAETLSAANASVPAYKEICSADISAAPFTDKNAVRSRIRDFKNTRFRGRSFKAQTSGTTGSPGVFLRDLDSINFEQAILWRQWAHAGKRPDSKRAVLRGDVVCPVGRTRPPFWKVDPFAKELILSSFHLSDANMPAYAEQLCRYGAFDLQAYPSTAYLLADYCLRTNTRLSFGAVFTSSEQLFDRQREAIEKAFGCKVYDWYGQAERVAAIGMCEKQSYHVIEDYSYVEFLPARDGFHEIAGTTFHNKVMPLIRYRTGDLVELGSGPCSCGSNFRTVKVIHGRESAFLRTPDGRRVSIVNHIPRGVPNLIELQFVQASTDEILMKVVVADAFSSVDEELLIQNAKKRISDVMQYRVERVLSIPRSKQGKFVPVISSLKVGSLP